MEKTYKISGAASPDVIQEEVAAAWDELRRDPKLRARLSTDDAAVTAALDRPATDAIQVRNPVSGFAAEAVVVAFLPLAVKIATDIWENIILPRIARRFGADALVEVPPAGS